MSADVNHSERAFRIRLSFWTTLDVESVLSSHGQEITAHQNTFVTDSRLFREVSRYGICLRDLTRVSEVLAMTEKRDSIAQKTFWGVSIEYSRVEKGEFKIRQQAPFLS